MAPSATTGDVTGCRERSRHTTAETWATTSTMTPILTRGLRGHEVSKPSMTDARWKAERIGPTIMAAPHRGQAHVVAVWVVVVGAVVSVDRCAIDGAASKRRASATRASIQTHRSRGSESRRA